MKKWSLMTIVGADRPGIVSAVTRVLSDNSCDLGETSMMRMGGNFAMMLRVQHDEIDLESVLADVMQNMNLHLHIDEDVGETDHQDEPDVNITVYGADRSGIVAEVTGVLADAGLNIIDLETAMAGSKEKPIYIMTLEGQAQKGIDALVTASAAINKDIELKISPIEILRA